MKFWGNEMDCWYFAYGSNMSCAQMASRTGPIRAGDEAPRVARLENYRLGFTMRGENNRYYANITASEPGTLPGEFVLGVLYRCGPAGMVELDVCEEGYARRQVTVTDQSGRDYDAVAYVSLPQNTASPGQPTARYLGIILSGAREFGLPDEYVQQIERLASRPA